MLKRRRRSVAPNACLVKDCGAQIPAWKRICSGCWRKLPFDRRRAIAQAGQDRAPHIVAQLALEAATWLSNQPSAQAASAALTARILGERDD